MSALAPAKKTGPGVVALTHHRSPRTPVSKRCQLLPSKCSTTGPLPSSAPASQTSFADVPCTLSRAAESLVATQDQASGADEAGRPSLSLQEKHSGVHSKPKKN